MVTHYRTRARITRLHRLESCMRDFLLEKVSSDDAAKAATDALLLPGMTKELKELAEQVSDKITADSIKV